MFPIPNRRSFLTRSAMGLGGIALAELLHAADAKKPNPFARILDKPTMRRRPSAKSPRTRGRSAKLTGVIEAML